MANSTPHVHNVQPAFRGFREQSNDLDVEIRELR